MGQAPSSELYAACAEGRIEQVQQLLKQGADVNSVEEEEGWTPLHYAAFGGHEKLVRELLVQGATVNARNADAKTPLHHAVLKRDHGVVQALCDHGGLVNAADEDGLTALHIAASQGLLDIAQELIARGANVNALEQDGTSAVHLAARQGHVQLLSYLLNSGADVDSGSIDGRTALHDAASSGQEAACKVLLKHNASLSTRDHEGHSPADLAQLKDLPGLEKLLRPTLDTEIPGPSSRLAEPSAPTWQAPASDSRVTYPRIAQLYPQVPEVTPPREPRQAAAVDGVARPGQDWEPRAEQDWEGVEAPQSVPSHGAALMDPQGTEDTPYDPLWMVPGPVKWAAGGLKGVVDNINPWRGARRAPEGHAEATQSDVQAVLQQKEEAAAKLTQPATKEALTQAQLARLQQQEAEIAELRRRLGQEDAAQSSRDAPGAADAVQERSSHQRHHLFDMDSLPGSPKAQAPSCRILEWGELQAVTDNFSRRLSHNQRGEFYRGELDGVPVAVWRPNHQSAVPWPIMKSIADTASASRSQHLVPLRGITQDGCEIHDLMLDGSVEGALSSRPPMPGRAAVRLDWRTRLAVAQSAAEGLAALQALSLDNVAAPVTPSRMLIPDTAAAPRLRPPDIIELASAPAVLSAHSAPEVQMGGPPSSASGTYSLGMLMLQLLTGSEATGLLDYVQRALERGKIEDILDPCAENVSMPQAVRLSNLALRCTSYHAQHRPNLLTEVIPELSKLKGQPQMTPAPGANSGAQEPPAHLVCPITQEVMEKPVLLSDGYTYEEDAILTWLRSGKKTSPMTNQPLRDLTMTPNYVIKSAAATWREADAAKIINELPDVPKSAIAATQSVRPLKEDSREGSNQGSGERVLLHA